METDKDLNKFIHLGPRKGTEAFRVKEEVEKRKKEVKMRGIDSLIRILFFDYLKNWFCGPDAWISFYKNKFPNTAKIIGEIQDRRVVDESSNLTDSDVTTVEFILNRNEYTFKFRTSLFSSGLLELYSNKTKIFALKVYADDNCFTYLKWKSHDIVAFIDGDWVSDFQNLKTAIGNDNKESAWHAAEDKSKTEELKKSFGID